MNHRSATLIVVALGLVIACAPTPVKSPGEAGAEEEVTPGAGGTEPTAAEGPTRQHELVAKIRDGKVEIDEDHHSYVTLGPGERVRFVCVDCPSELELTAFDLHPVLDLDHLYNHERISALETALENGDLEELREQLAPAFLRLPDSYSTYASGNDQGESDAPAGRRSIPSWGTGRGKAEYSSEAFSSPPVPQGVGTVLWKFTWRVRQKGDQSECMESDLCAEWDPHIVTKP